MPSLHLWITSGGQLFYLRRLLEEDCELAKVGEVVGV